MKKLFFYLFAISLLASCFGGGNGELIGVQGRPLWYQPDPYGMVWIPMGSFQMGASDQDVPYGQTARAKTVSVQAFYMDDTEITNNEYRQFVYYVRDSIARYILGVENDMEEYVILEDEFGEEYDPPFLNWRTRLYWDGEEEREALAEMFYPEHERFYRRKELDTRKLIFHYYWIDLQEAAKKSGLDLDLGYEDEKFGHYNDIWRHEDRSKFIIFEKIPVYPDTLVWVRDFTFSFNDPMTNMYFWHPAYDDYPVVGVTWKQTMAFNRWRTQLMNSYREYRYEDYVQDFRLPTEAEWERAARGGLANSPYPWGGPYIRNRKGCFLGNFKPLRGNYIDDGGFHTVKVTSYSPNDFGLWCMAGNVAEWTSTAFHPAGYDFDHDLNPEYSYDAKKGEAPVMKRKVVRGGSWKDVAYYLQTGSRAYEYQDTATSYIGFRSVTSFLGRAKGDDI
jgi:formylglycine-generating enzyme